MMPLVTSPGDSPATAPSDPPPTAVEHDLRPLFSPRGVAVIGASSDPTKLGGAMAASLASFPGPVALVNPRGGQGMHATIGEAVRQAAAPIDLAIVCVPARACAEVIRECAAAGVRAALVCAGGFAEAGGDGPGHQERLVAAARETGVRLLGPNTSGFFVPSAGLAASFVPGAGTFQPGSVAVVAASGGLNHALAFALQREGTGLTLGVGIGAGLDVAAPEVVRFLGEDPATTAVALHLESVLDGPALLDAVRTTSRRKPVVALVVGEHDVSDFARSHTGALATSWRTTTALLRQAGAVVVDNERAMVSAAGVLALARATAHRAPGAALVTAQAGPGLLVADALHGAGVRVPPLATRTRERLGELLPPLTYQANPVDTGRPGPQLSEVLSAVAEDESVDVLSVYALTEPVVDLVETVLLANLHGRVAVVGIDGPEDDVVAAREAARKASIPLVVGPTALACAVDALVQDARHQHDLAVEVSEAPPRGNERVPVLDGPLTEAAAKDVLGTLGIVTMPRRVCGSREEALEALAELGEPVAVKVSATDIVHKSDAGGVRLWVRDETGMAEAYAAMAALGGGEVLVERMADGGVDLIVGALRDPVFGPVVMVGVGGVATEIYADVAIAAVPASAERLARLTEQLRGRRLVDGFRGARAVPAGELGSLLATLGRFLLDHPEVQEVEINPLRATDDALVALDAVVLISSRGEPDDEPETHPEKEGAP